jgi:hypothetical protein
VNVRVKVSGFAIAAAALSFAGRAVATGFPPFVVDDSATVPRGGQVSVLDNGQASVLANDIDVEGDPITAELTRAPRRGTLVLNPDGTFLYTHNGSDNDTDEFRYRAFDGTRRSSEADVRITVTATAIAPVITGQAPLATVEDGSLEIRLQDLIVEDPDSDYPRDFSLILDGGDNYAVEGAVVTPSPDFNGTLTVPTRVNDGQADSNVFPLSVSVASVNDPPLVMQPVADQQATEGEPYTLDLAPSFADVDVGDTLTFSASGLPPSGSLSLSPDGLLSGTPQQVDTLILLYRVIVTARDAIGAAASTEFALSIEPRRVDLSISIEAEPEPTTLDDVPFWSLEATNVSTSSSEPTTLIAEWRSTGGPVTLTTSSGCTVVDGAEEAQVRCDVAVLPPGGAALVRVQGEQPEPGDQAVVARLEVEDANDANDVAFKSLNVAGSLSAESAQQLPGAGADLAAGDLDDDGYTDVVAVGDQTRIFFHSGAKTLDTTATLPPGESGGDAVALIDWNGDSRLDVAVLDRDGDAGRVFVNDGARGFGAADPLPPVAARAAAVIDRNLDGRDELVVTGAFGTVMLAPGAAPVVLDGRAGRGLATADLNGDNRTDVAVAVDGGAVVVIENDGSGSFSTTTLSGFGSVAGVGAGDLTGDGAPDLLLAAAGAELGAPENLVLRNDRDGSFTEVYGFGATSTEQLLAADVNADGLVDVVAVNATGVHQVYLNDEALELVLQSEFLLSPGAATAELAHVDSDGVPDLFLAGASAASVAVLRNNGIGGFGLGDIVPPVIRLNGAASMTISAASTYVDPGATATDDVSGDLTAAIVVDNTVNPAVLGTYEVRYDVTDRAGNAATAVRTVTVAAATGGGGGGGRIDAYLLAVLASLLGLSRARSRRRAS